MVSPQLRTLVQRVGSRALFRATTKPTTVAPLSSLRPFSVGSRAAALHDKGVIDEHGYTNFETLHELRLSACEAYYDHDLFGTYAPAVDGKEGGEYKWMTYEEFNGLVDKTRSVLEDLGKHHSASVHTHRR
jgi:hypothetical protein